MSAITSNPRRNGRSNKSPITRKPQTVKVRWDLSVGKWGVLDKNNESKFVRNFDRGIMTDVIFDNEYTRHQSGCGGTYSGIAVGRLAVHGKKPNTRGEPIKFNRNTAKFESNGFERIDAAKVLILTPSRKDAMIIR